MKLFFLRVSVWWHLWRLDRQMLKMLKQREAEKAAIATGDRFL